MLPTRLRSPGDRNREPGFTAIQDKKLLREEHRAAGPSCLVARGGRPRPAAIAPKQCRSIPVGAGSTGQSAIPVRSAPRNLRRVDEPVPPPADREHPGPRRRNLGFLQRIGRRFARPGVSAPAVEPAARRGRVQSDGRRGAVALPPVLARVQEHVGERASHLSRRGINAGCSGREQSTRAAGWRATFPPPSPGSHSTGCARASSTRRTRACRPGSASLPGPEAAGEKRGRRTAH